MSQEQMESLEIDLTQRPENVGLRDYVRISDLIDQSSEPVP